ncbi:MAG: Gfo/Idh/MocA family protein [Thermodesulfobacteriota bacterium]
MAKLRVGVVGIGYLGKYHVEKYAALPEVEIVGLADIVLERAKEWAEKVKAEAHADYHELLGKVQAVSIVVPPDRHYAIAKDFLTAGCHVLLEKPMAASIAEADDLIATAKKKGCLIQVGHLERFNPALMAAQKKISVPLFIEAHRLTPFRNRGVEVDVVLDLMIHDLDIILHLVKAEVEKIEAVGVPVLSDKVDIASARLEFKSGCIANITASRISFNDQRKMRIFQPDSYLTIDFAQKKAAIYYRPKIEINEHPSITMETIEVKPGDALQMEIQSFVHAVIQHRPPLVSGEEGRKALALALEINKQIQANLKKIPAIVSFYQDN